MSDLDLYTHHPLQLDPQSKAISLPGASSDVAAELEQLNRLHAGFVALETPGKVPPPPMPVNPKRSAQITKLKESANQSFAKGTYIDSVRLYTLAIDMALSRPLWEPASLVREELAVLYSNRSQSYIAQQMWPEGLIDAKLSVACSPVKNAKSWYRGGKSLNEMARYDEAKEWLEKAIEIEAATSETTKDLEKLLADAVAGLARTGSSA
ncbi:Bifunctional purine biosynthetic protein ade1 [Ascosphaera pollenicola]|nr:Bifunctional purine biosynthetic protein ade1 [Ascosphaera pollenicola]